MYIEVRGSNKEGLERALNEFKRLVKKDELMKSLKKHEFYVKPSLKRKLKRVEALKRKRREEHDEVRRTKDSRNHS